MTDTAIERARCRDLTTSDVLVWTGNARRSCDTVKIIDRRKDTDDGWWMTDGSGLADSVWDNGTAWVTLADLIAAREALAGIKEREQAVKHYRTGPGRCACGYNAYAVGGFFPDYHAMLMSHFTDAERNARERP